MNLLRMLFAHEKMLSSIIVKSGKPGVCSLLLVLLFLSGNLFGQGEDNHWFFGNNVHVDFNTSPPAVTAGNMYALEGSSAVSNAAGELLFYSDGHTVWDAASNTMPNGTGLLGNQVTSSSQGVNIMQFPDNPAKYYLFVGESLYQGFGGAITNGTVRYSVVDMSLNGGLGDIVASQKNIILGSGYSEEMSFAHGPTCNTAWFVVRDTVSQIHAYFVSASGISTTPVVSNFPTMPNVGRIGNIKISPDDNHIAWTSNSGGFAMIADFNRTNGTVTNIQTITGVYAPYGVAFSPDNSKLYIATESVVKQYDLSLLPNLTGFLNSAYNVTSAYLSYMSLRLGPDGKIYILKNSNNPIFAINAPNVGGVGCSLNTNAIQTLIGTNPIIGLGAAPFTFAPYDTVAGLVLDSIVCFQEAITINAPAHYNKYQWNNGSIEQSIILHDDSESWVALTNDTVCQVRIDSFKITFEAFQVNLGQDTVICSGDKLHLNAQMEHASYLWKNGETQSSITVEDPGLYYVTVTRNDCSNQDSINVALRYSHMNITESDTTICDGKPMTLHANGSADSRFLWSTGETTAEITIHEKGTYKLQAFDACGELVDSMKLSTERCDCLPWVPSAFSPNADGVNDILIPYIACPAFNNYRFVVYNRFGQPVFESYNATNGWNGMHKDRPADMGTYFYRLSFNSDGTEFHSKGDITLLR